MRTALTVRGADGAEKVYEATDEDVTMGLCEDAMKAFRVDLMVGGDEGSEKEMTRALVQNLMGFYPLASRLFPGLTEEEYRTARPREVVQAMRALMTYAIEQLGTIMADQPPKNRPRGRRSPSTRPCSTSASPYRTGSLR